MGSLLIKKMLISALPLKCCPFCGARLIDSRGGVCSACGSHIPEGLIRAMLYAQATKAMREAMAPIGMRDIASMMADAADKVSTIMSSIERRIYARFKERLEEAGRKDDKAETTRIMEEMRSIKARALERLQQVQQAQLAALTSGSVEDMEKAFRELETAKKELADYVDPEVLSLYVIPEFSLRVAEKYYQASRFEEAIKWYGLTIASALFPETKKQELPVALSLGYIPFGAIFLGSYDVDYDGIPELFYVPSRELAGLRAACVVINEMGTTWEPVKGYEMLLPLFGDFLESTAVLVAWKNSRLLDAKFFDLTNREMRIRYHGETMFSLPIIMAKAWDVDGDGIYEIIASSTRGRLLILRPADGALNAESITIGSIIDMVFGRFGKRRALIALTIDGRLALLDPLDMEIRLLATGIEDASSATLYAGDLDGDLSDEIYVATVSGLIRIVERDGEFTQTTLLRENVLGCGIWDIDGDGAKELIVASMRNGGIGIHIYGLKKFLDVETLEEKAFLPAGLQRPVRRAHMSMDTPFFSRPIILVDDVDGDGSCEIFIGLERALMAIDMRYS